MDELPSSVIIAHMKQDPEYLKNQSRSGHARYRWNRAYLNATTLSWAALFALLFLVALLDRIAEAGWGFADHLWGFLGSSAFGLCLWVFGTLIQKLILSYVRHTYGPEPID